MVNFCFEKQHRIKKSFEFKRLSFTAETLKRRFFIVLYKQGQANQTRLGITISKRCSKKAVERNRLKRVIRESFRLNKHKLDNYDIVIIGRKYAIDADHKQLFKELESVWQKLAVYCKQS